MNVQTLHKYIEYKHFHACAETITHPPSFGVRVYTHSYPHQMELFRETYEVQKNEIYDEIPLSLSDFDVSMSSVREPVDFSVIWLASFSLGLTPWVATPKMASSHNYAFFSYSNIFFMKSGQPEHLWLLSSTICLQVPLIDIILLIAWILSFNP